MVSQLPDILTAEAVPQYTGPNVGSCLRSPTLQKSSLRFIRGLDGMGDSVFAVVRFALLNCRESDRSAVALEVKVALFVSRLEVWLQTRHSGSIKVAVV